MIIYKMGHVQNYVKEKKSGNLTKNIYPNCGPVTKEQFNKVHDNIAQEQAYWIQLGTQTFEFNEKYQPETFEFDIQYKQWDGL